MDREERLNRSGQRGRQAERDMEDSLPAEELLRKEMHDRRAAPSRQK